MSPAHEARIQAVRAMPCVACLYQKCQQPWPTEAHHIVDNGYRRLSGGHDATIPLCSWHHRALCLDGLNSSGMMILYGPSLKDHKKRFIQKYGRERHLLDRTDASLRFMGVIPMPEEDCERA